MSGFLRVPMQPLSSWLEILNVRLSRKITAQLGQKNTDFPVYGLLQSISDIEDRFNKPRQYPYVILNEDNSSAEFKQHITALTRAPVYFGKIAPEDWNEPTWIDQSRAEAERRTARYVYGQSQSYRRM